MKANQNNQHPEMRWCVAQGIRIYPEPTNTPGDYVLIVETNGVAVRGTEVFGSKKTPGRNTWWDQIYLLYQIIHKNKNHEQKNQNQEAAASAV
jgi:hypothetical protein